MEKKVDKCGYFFSPFIYFSMFFSRLPAGLTQLRNLTHLGLNDVSLSWLPKDIGRYITKNLPLQYTEIFSAVEIENFTRKILIYF